MKSEFENVFTGDWLLGYKLADGKQTEMRSVQVTELTEDEITVLVPASYRKSDGKISRPFPDRIRTSKIEF